MCYAGASVRFLLLIYTVPPTPTAKRAFVWRLLKKLGAVYLRDGACVLPDRADTRVGLYGVADKVREFGGQASLAENAQLDESTVDLVRGRSREARQAEYIALVEAGTSLATHINREVRHRDLTSAELAILEGDLLKLRRWRDQIGARDYFSTDCAAEADQILTQCRAVLDRLPDTSPAALEPVR
jgi:hypothetical protein